MKRRRRDKSSPGRYLHIGRDETPDVPRYADSLLRSRNADTDNKELTRVLRQLEDTLLVPRARVPALVLDALYLYASVNKIQLPFSDYTRTRHEEDNYVQRFLHWYYREIERKK